VRCCRLISDSFLLCRQAEMYTMHFLMIIIYGYYGILWPFGTYSRYKDSTILVHPFSLVCGSRGSRICSKLNSVELERNKVIKSLCNIYKLVKPVLRVEIIIQQQ
jgi:hypothetical protein